MYSPPPPSRTKPAADRGRPAAESPDDRSFVPASERVAHRIGRARSRVVDHPLYRQIRSLADLRRFQEHHVFCVWDFMCVVKRLEHMLAVPRMPWVPLAHAPAARFIKELCLGEETDLLPDGRIMSHLDLYIESMHETGADTAPIERWIDGLRAGTPWPRLLADAGLPAAVCAFVQSTMDTVENGTPEEVAASLLFGREDPIPHMFTAIVDTLDREHLAAPAFRVYLERHIELDAGEHHDAASGLLDLLIGDSSEREGKATRSASTALRARGDLWDALMPRQ